MEHDKEHLDITKDIPLGFSTSTQSGNSQHDQ